MGIFGTLPENKVCKKQVEFGLRFLAEADKILITSLDSTTCLTGIAQLIVPQLADWCSIDLIEADGSIQPLILVHTNPAKAEFAQALRQRHPVNSKALFGLADVLRTGKAELYSELPQLCLEAVTLDADHLQFLQEIQLESLMIVPLVARGRTLGAITIVSAESGRHYSEVDLVLAEELAGRAALALDNARIYEAEQEARKAAELAAKHITRLYEAEQKARTEAEATQPHLALLAETRERNRLAQELHDNVAQALGYLNLKLAMTNSLLSEGQIEEAKTSLQELRNIVSETYTDVREEIFDLRAKVFSGLGFLDLLDKYIDKYRRFYKLNIELIKEEDEALFEFPPDVGPQIIRIIQEALINVRKHAKVDETVIRLGQEAGQIRIAIEDKGQGFNPGEVLQKKKSSFGLQIMQERAESIGGALEVRAAPGQGSQVVIRLPIFNRAVFCPDRLERVLVTS
jgi:signal transduction histidine kinase